MYCHGLARNVKEGKESHRKMSLAVFFVLSVISFSIEQLRTGSGNQKMITCCLYNVQTITLRYDNKRPFKIETTEIKIKKIYKYEFMHYNVVPFYAGSITD